MTDADNLAAKEFANRNCDWTAFDDATKAFLAGIAFERKRAEKLEFALQNLGYHSELFRNSHIQENDLIRAEETAIKVLKEYEGGDE